ncbi:MAG: dicarboxylate/amino acid:cation symporter [Bryobacterales bacterium]|nr:dicarboxylate/amino acid:cation symporter [Bryobacterales bacterium]
MQLYTKILIALGLGVATGATANLAEIEWLRGILVSLEPVGTVFIRLITMIVIPLVISSLLVGTASLGDIRKLGRIGSKTFGYYMLTTVLAISLGLVVSNLFKPGSRIDPTTRDRLAANFEGKAKTSIDAAAKAPTLKDVLVNLVPRNPVQAAAEFDLLPLIFFSIVFGAAVSLVDGPPREAVLAFFDGISRASMIVIGWVMLIAPYAVFALIASVVAQFGLDLLRSLMLYTLVVAGGLLLHVFGTVGFMVYFAARMSPVEFFKRIVEVPLFAFSTSSSNATLPVSISTAERKLGISKEIGSFVLPLGATINMDGTALYQAVAVMFIAQIYGIDLTWTQQLTVVVTATLASVGAAGVPSAGLITLIIVLQSIGLGNRVEAGIALILGVDRILDMLRTAVNVTGDMSCAAFIARTEGEDLHPAVSRVEAGTV